MTCKFLTVVAMRGALDRTDTMFNYEMSWAQIERERETVIHSVGE
jgi:hypothetical protein